jgi:hypothetical protein
MFTVAHSRIVDWDSTNEDVVSRHYKGGTIYTVHPQTLLASLHLLLLWLAVFFLYLLFRLSTSHNNSSIETDN